MLTCTWPKKKIKIKKKMCLFRIQTPFFVSLRWLTLYPRPSQITAPRASKPKSKICRSRGLNTCPKVTVTELSCYGTNTIFNLRVYARWACPFSYLLITRYAWTTTVISSLNLGNYSQYQAEYSALYKGIRFPGLKGKC
uniref:ARAD1C11154p n=1 Tax=Blastobotrys adeninivorans TaxID=409370 RepID=A0A060T5D1_BLAAD